MNGIDSSCTDGICYALSKYSDLCYLLDYPCGESNPSTNFECRRPCDLSYYVKDLIAKEDGDDEIVELESECFFLHY